MPTVTVPPQVRIVSFVGFSGSGKTTLIERLIRYFTARGSRVAALKHTHHPLTELSRGDTERFLRAGACEVVLANDSDAVRWRPDDADGTRFRFADRRALIARFKDIDWLLVEGFKSDPPGVAVAVGELDHYPENTVAHVTPLPGEDCADLGAFLDRIAAS